MDAHSANAVDPLDRVERKPLEDRATGNSEQLRRVHRNVTDQRIQLVPQRLRVHDESLTLHQREAFQRVLAIWAPSRALAKRAPGCCLHERGGHMQQHLAQRGTRFCAERALCARKGKARLMLMGSHAR